MRALKTFILPLLFANSAFAIECVDQNGLDISTKPEIFIPLISEQSSCSSAAQLARACQWGSAIDVSTAGVAQKLCLDELISRNPPKNIWSTLEAMETLCADKFAHLDGSMWQSALAYCALSAIEWVNDTSTDPLN